MEKKLSKILDNFILSYKVGKPSKLDYTLTLSLDRGRPRTEHSVLSSVAAAERPLRVPSSSLRGGTAWRTLRGIF